MTDHRERMVFGISVVNVAFPRLGRAERVGEILIEVIAKVIAPNQMTAEIAVSEGNDVDLLVREQSQRNDQPLIPLAAGHGAANETLPE